MCGRYALFSSLQDICRAFGVEPSTKHPPQMPLNPYNIGPMTNAPIIIGAKLGSAQWAFLPSWADDENMAVKLKNARSESAHEKPAFRDAWAKGQRCAIPMNGFYEWQKTGSDSGPHFVTPAQNTYQALEKQPLIAAAGLWAIRNNQIGFTVLTKPARPELSGIHHREPVLFAPEDTKLWLTAPLKDAQEMMRNKYFAPLYHWRVTPDVGHIKNNGPSLIEADHHQNLLL